jgi:hypothetical protein
MYLHKAISSVTGRRKEEKEWGIGAKKRQRNGRIYAEYIRITEYIEVHGDEKGGQY